MRDDIGFGFPALQGALEMSRRLDGINQFDSIANKWDHLFAAQKTLENVGIQWKTNETQRLLGAASKGMGPAFQARGMMNTLVKPFPMEVNQWNQISAITRSVASYIDSLPDGYLLQAQGVMGNIIPAYNHINIAQEAISNMISGLDYNAGLLAKSAAQALQYAGNALDSVVTTHDYPVLSAIADKISYIEQCGLNAEIVDFDSIIDDFELASKKRKHESDFFDKGTILALITIALTLLQIVLGIIESKHSALDMAKQLELQKRQAIAAEKSAEASERAAEATAKMADSLEIIAESEVRKAEAAEKAVTLIEQEILEYNETKEAMKDCIFTLYDYLQEFQEDGDTTAQSVDQSAQIDD